MKEKTLPRHIIKDCVFPFLSTLDTFKLRAVNNNWCELARSCWLKALKIALHHHVLL